MVETQPTWPALPTLRLGMCCTECRLTSCTEAYIWLLGIIYTSHAIILITSLYANLKVTVDLLGLLCNRVGFYRIKVCVDFVINFSNSDYAMKRGVVI